MGNQIPRGWHLYTASAVFGATVSLNLPASPNVSHVITGIHAVVKVTTVGSGGYAIVARAVTVPWLGGLALGDIIFGLSQIATAPASYVGGDTFDWSGEVALPVGTGGAFAITALGAAGELQTLEVLGYDI